jgi:hypothetical protein
MHRRVEAELRPILLAKIREEERELLKIEAEAELRPVRISRSPLFPPASFRAFCQLRMSQGSWIIDRHLLKQPQRSNS